MNHVAVDAPRWVVVVEVDHSDVYAGLRRSFDRAPWVNVVVDRRRGPRRQHPPASLDPDRRLSLNERRRAAADPSLAPDHRLAYRGEGFMVYEATALAAVACPDCHRIVHFEMPRFAEPPARLEVRVVHEIFQATYSRHFVELESWTSTGRGLLASRLAARAASPGPSPVW